MTRRKTQKIMKSSPRNMTTGRCPKCATIGKIFLIGQTGSEKGKCQKCRAEFEL